MKRHHTEETPSYHELPVKEWSRFFDRLGSLNDSFITELDNCWRDMRSILDNLQALHDMASVPGFDLLNLHVFGETRAALGKKFLHGLLSQWEANRPLRRTTMAVEMYDRGVEEIIRVLPESKQMSGSQAVQMLGNWAKQGPWRRLALLRQKNQELPLRNIVAAELRKWARRRSRIEGRFFLALAQAIRELTTPWEIERTATDTAAIDADIPDIQTDPRWESLRQKSEQIVQQAGNALLEWRIGSMKQKWRLGERILARMVLGKWRRISRVKDSRYRCRAHWTSQLQTVDAEMRLHQTLEQTERRILDLFHGALESVSAEKTSIRSELDRVIDWHSRQLEQTTSEEFPPPGADIVPASQRLDEILNSLKIILAEIPDTYDLAARLSALPQFRSRHYQLHPGATFLREFTRTAQREITIVLENLVEGHRKVVQEIERAREVVTFGREAIDAQHQSKEQIAREALQNALSLLHFYREEDPDWRAEAEIRFSRALAAVFLEYRMVLNRNWMGLFTFFAKEGLRQGMVLAARGASATLKKSLQGLLELSGGLWLRFQIFIGWKRAPSAGKFGIVTRAYLPREYTMDLRALKLPALYRHLFRFEPVQDPRFLVGREREIAAITEARSIWEAGRPAAVILVGVRGSGKTSLLNCAIKGPLRGMEIVHGEFGERAMTSQQLRGFLATVTGNGDSEKLEAYFKERRRVVILEELERTFIRQVGYLGAIQELQRLIAASCSSTLWILSINQVAFCFLAAAVSLGASFSHRINVSMAAREDLRTAILLRHNLSGLRLQFLPPPPQRGLARRVRNIIQGQADSEAVFFDALGRDSAGVYRTAFNIWLSHMQEIQGGLLKMKPIISPDLLPMMAALDLPDLFTLVAIMQHGSLKPEEHSIIFQCGISFSQAQMDELVSREIIESDPSHEGYRIRPEAAGVVKEGLRRLNLL